MEYCSIYNKTFCTVKDHPQEVVGSSGIPGEAEQSALSSSSFHLYLQSIAGNHMLNAQQESFIA